MGDIFAALLLISYCSFSSLIWSSLVMITLYIYFRRFFLNLNGLSNGKLVSLTKDEYSSTVDVLQIFIKSLKSIYLMNDLMQFFQVLFYLEFS